MSWLEPVVLRARIADAAGGHDLRLEPLTRDHRDGLAVAVADGELWNLWYTTIPSPEGMAAEIERRLRLQRAGTMQPFTVLVDGQVLGMTSFMNADEPNRRLEIGSTWLRSSAQRSGVNTLCKLLLLTHAFEALDCIAVEFRTHFFNRRSRGAIERLGAKLDGVLRSHQRAANGTLRDTCVYSITAAEWPTVKMHLAASRAPG